MSQLPIPRQERHLKELALVFLKLGFIAFGGPAAHTAMMEDEIVERKRWLSHEKFLDLIGVTNLIPGPNSTELAIHLGYERGGWLGLIVAGSCFILPAMVLVWLLAIAYVHFEQVPLVVNVLYGIKPMIIPLIAQALWKLGRKAIKNTPTILVALLVMAGAALGQSEIFLLLIGGIGLIIFQAWQERSRNLPLFFLPLGTLEIPSNPTPHPVNAFSVFAVFLKIGSVLYGGGYVLVAFLQTDLVNRLGWLTSQQLLDAIAIGQITPGPLFTTATFIGYLLAGNGGAIAATVGIFLPSFILVLLVNPWVGYLRRSARFSAFLNGVNAGAWGLMMTTTLFLAHSALIDPVTIGLAIVGAICLWGFSLKSHWLVLIGMAVGIYLSI